VTRIRDDRGQVAGVETVAIGVLVFVAGLLIATNAWSVLTTRQVADSIAREYVHAYSEQPTRSAALSAAREAAETVRSTHRIDPDRLTIDEPTEFAPCALATVRVVIRVPMARLPFLGTVGGLDVTVTQRERIDPYRAGIEPVPTSDEPCARR
jgi:hypothetical protein